MTIVEADVLSQITAFVGSYQAFIVIGFVVALAGGLLRRLVRIGR